MPRAAVMIQPAACHPCGTPVVAATWKIAKGTAMRRTAAIDRSRFSTGLMTGPPSCPPPPPLARPAPLLREPRVVAASVLLEGRARALVADVPRRDERVPL